MFEIAREKLFYEKLSQKKLSNAEVIEARQNFIGFFDLLYKVDKREKEKQQVTTEKSSNLSHIS